MFTRVEAAQPSALHYRPRTRTQGTWKVFPKCKLNHILEESEDLQQRRTRFDSVASGPAQSPGHVCRRLHFSVTLQGDLTGPQEPTVLELGPQFNAH